MLSIYDVIEAKSKRIIEIIQKEDAMLKPMQKL
jgi:hypothetical protein